MGIISFNTDHEVGQLSWSIKRNVPSRTVRLSQLGWQHDGGTKCLLEALKRVHSTNWGFAKTIRSFLVIWSEITQQERAGGKDMSLDSLYISKLHPKTGT